MKEFLLRLALVGVWLCEKICRKDLWQVRTRHVRKRVAWLMQAARHAATEASTATRRPMAAAAASEAAAHELHMHRRLWSLPSLLLRTPSDGDAALGAPSSEEAPRLPGAPTLQAH